MIQTDVRHSLAALSLSLSAFCFTAGCDNGDRSLPDPPQPKDSVASAMNELNENLMLDHETDLWGRRGFHSTEPEVLPGSLRNGSAEDRMSSETREMTKAERLARVQELGNGVYVFPATRDFPETLADFREKHPDIISVTLGPPATILYYSSHRCKELHSQSNAYVVVTGSGNSAESIK